MVHSTQGKPARNNMMNTRILMRFRSLLVGALLSLSACSVAMESTRPTPVDMSQFAVGESRLQVAQTLGVPLASLRQGQDSCDVYKLYTRGPSAVGKGAIAATEAAADVLTLGLAEIVSSPIEGSTRNVRHTVTMCYDGNDKLVAQSDSGPATD